LGFVFHLVGHYPPVIMLAHHLVFWSEISKQAKIPSYSNITHLNWFKHALNQATTGCQSLLHNLSSESTMDISSHLSVVLKGHPEIKESEYNDLRSNCGNRSTKYIQNTHNTTGNTFNTNHGNGNFFAGNQSDFTHFAQPPSLNSNIGRSHGNSETPHAWGASNSASSSPCIPSDSPGHETEVQNAVDLLTVPSESDASPVPDDVVPVEAEAFEAPALGPQHIEGKKRGKWYRLTTIFKPKSAP